MGGGEGVVNIRVAYAAIASGTVALLLQAESIGTGRGDVTVIALNEVVSSDDVDAVGGLC